MIEVSGLSKSYDGPDGPIEVLKGVSFSARAGESLAIVGPSGSGKSTLLSLLAGLDVPDHGDVIIDGQSICRALESDLSKIRQTAISIVFQRFHLMQSLTALENVQLPLEIQNIDNAKDKAREWIEAVGLSHREQHFPRHLSGGECQRVAIARALATNPKVLLADEPSGNLDQATGSQVMSLLYELANAHGRCLILVTHNEEHAKKCGRQLLLSEGQLISL